MAKVSFVINGRKYALGCDEGEEERLMRLGQKLDDRVNTMANQFGQIGDLKLMVMAGIMTVAAGFVRGTNPPDLKLLLGSWLCVDRGLHNSDAHLNLRFTRILKRPRTKWGRHIFS